MAKEYLKVGCALTEGVGGDKFIYLGEAGGLLDGFLQAGFVDMVALLDTSNGVSGMVGGGEDVLPGPFAVSVGIFFFEGVG